MLPSVLSASGKVAGKDLSSISRRGQRNDRVCGRLDSHIRIHLPLGLFVRREEQWKTIRVRVVIGGLRYVATLVL